MSVSAGQMLYIYVGGVGVDGLNNFGLPNPTGGYNGGAEGYHRLGSGGGATDVRIGGNTLNDRKLVAGGGGVGGKYGGGAGYYGGGGSSEDAGSSDSGGGGSSYTDPDLCTNVVHTQGYSEATGNGWITITTSNE